MVTTERLRDPMSRMGGSRLWAVRATGEGKRLVSEGDAIGPRSSDMGRRFAISPDGRRFLMVCSPPDVPALGGTGSTRQLFVVQNGFAELRRSPSESAP